MLLFPWRELSVSCEAAFCMHGRGATELCTLGTPCKVGKDVCITTDTLLHQDLKDVTFYFNVEILCIICVLSFSPYTFNLQLKESMQLPLS